MTATTDRPPAPPAVPRSPGRAARPEPRDTTREAIAMSAQPEFTDRHMDAATRDTLRRWTREQERRDAEAQVFAALPGESWKPLEDRHTGAELARRVRLLERQVADTERQRDDYQRRLANAEIALGRLRARPRPWWRR